MKIIQFIKTNDFELFVTDESKVYQRETYFKSTGGMYKSKEWGSWYKRNLEKELSEDQIN